MKSTQSAKVLGTVLVAVFFASTQTQALDVREAIAETLATNPQVLAELREVDARNRQVREALGDYYPDVDLLAGIGFQERDPTQRLFSDPTRTRNELERHEAQLNISQLVFDGFKTPNEHKNQQAREKSAQHRAKSVAEDVSLAVVRVFMEVLKTEAILKLAEETLAFHEDVYDRMKKRFDSGVGSRADLDQISSRRALAQTNVFNARANLLDAKTNFQNVVGRFPAEGELSKPGSYRKYLPVTVEDAIVKAVDTHPVLKIAEADIEAVSYQYEQTKSPYYPEFRVEVERDLNDNIDGIEEQVDDLRVMLRMRYNLYNGRSNQARKQRFAYLVEKAREVRNDAYRQVEQEVRLAWVAYNTIKEQIPSLQSYAADTVKTKNAYIDQFDLGRRTLLDLLNTETESVNAKRDLITAQHDLIFNEYRVFKAMGDLMYMVGAKI